MSCSYAHFLSALCAMTMAQCVALASSIPGLCGTMILFLGSNALEPFAGGVFGSQAVTDRNEKVKRKNKHRKQMQRAGLFLLFSSFATQIGAIILS
jgi:hypothetical protein